MAKCAHIWIANRGEGGKPRFDSRFAGAGELLMRVRCCECADQQWMTEAEWFAMNEAQDSNA